MKRFSLVLLLSFVFFLACSKDTVNETQEVQITRTANLKNAGDSARDFLSSEKFKNLLIEIGYVKGFNPTQETISNFTAFLGERINKDKIDFVFKELPSSGKDSLSIQEIVDLEKEHRSFYNDDDTLSLYIYFSDAPSSADKPEEDLVTLGAVYRNTSMVIYEATIRNIASKSILLSNTTVETATLHHEAGHLFGLVDLGSPSVNDHTDPEADSHCNVDGCLMRAELQFGSGMRKMLAAKNGAIPDFGAECLRDLKANGGK
ncbi:hypothetical protein HCG49_15730 [Arenibacter sp. 6A1]|uniref:hypothetical protein n=1 Tax=Arenibacter sp. 6A1 TaxID=2720391 RepID=UPI00144702F4|nr:hypothetical protein [Arenibacter sp. 6A1]NKI28012.1 hypothetical protein [Arenibacter sp. 6A1]